MVASSLSAGTPTQFGRYEVVAPLATGGMAELYLARLRGHGGFEKLVAIKRMLPHLSQDRHFVEMFLDEGRIAARLNHPNICQVFELGDVDGQLYIAMEYVPGIPFGTIAAALPRTADAFDLRVAAGILIQASEGAHYSHEHRGPDGRATPIIHRDISPSNLLVTPDGVCKLVDFGISKILTEASRTRTGVLKGKPSYMAPEQIRAEPFDQRADVFALGILLWEAVAGRKLFVGDSDFLIWKAITEDPVPRLATVRRGVPPAIDELLRSTLAKDPARRPDSARAFGAALRRAVAPIGGVMEPPALAAYLAVLCADAFAARAAPFGDAIARARRGDTHDDDGAPPSGAPDLHDAPTASIQIRAGTAPIAAPEPAPEPTLAPAPPRRRWPAIAIAGALAVTAALAIAVVASGSAGPGEASGAAVAPAPASTTTTAPASTTTTAPAPTTTTAPASPPPTSAPSAPPPTPRRVRAAADRPRPAATTAAPGYYVIDSTPYAHVYIDDRDYGTTPLFRVEVPAGSHRVRAVLGDGRRRQFTITVRPGKELSSGHLRW